MMFSTILVSFLLIGSTVAESELQMFTSLSYVDDIVRSHILILGNVYCEGPDVLKERPEYKSFLKQQNIIEAEMRKLTSSEPATHSAQEVYEGWTTAALGIINVIISGSDWTRSFTGKETATASDLVVATITNMMDSINTKDGILPIHRGNRLSIFNDLAKLIDDNISPEKGELFRQKCKHFQD